MIRIQALYQFDTSTFIWSDGMHLFSFHYYSYYECDLMFFGTYRYEYFCQMHKLHKSMRHKAWLSYCDRCEYSSQNWAGSWLKHKDRLSRYWDSLYKNKMSVRRLAFIMRIFISLQWRHNGSDSVLNHQPHDCLFNCLFREQIKENIKAPRHWPLCGEFTGDRWIPRTNGQ